MQAREITADFVAKNYLQPFGTSSTTTDPLCDGEGNPVSDTLIQTQIEGSIGELESTLGLFASPKRVKTNPDFRHLVLGTDYDVEGRPLTFNQADALRFNELHLPHSNIITVDNIDLYHATKGIGHIPPEWIVIKARKEAIIHLVPLGGGVLINEITFLGVGVRSYFFRDKVPGFWVCDYTCGLQELTNDLRDYICFRTALIVLGIVAAAKFQGVSSESLSIDGMSQSVSTIASGMFSRYGDLQKLFTDLNINLPKKRVRYRGIRVGGI